MFNSNNKIFFESGIVQTVIKEETYQIMMICKDSGGNIDLIEEYIKKIYLNTQHLPYKDLYIILSRTIIDACNKEQIEQILTIDINDAFKRKLSENFPNNMPLDYKDLCKMLIIKLTLLKVRDEHTDLFLIDINNLIMTMDDYDNSYGNKVKQKK